MNKCKGGSLKDWLVVVILITLIISQLFSTKNTIELYTLNAAQDEINVATDKQISLTSQYLEYLPQALNSVFGQIRNAFLNHEARIQSLEKKNEEPVKP